MSNLKMKQSALLVLASIVSMAAMSGCLSTKDDQESSRSSALSNDGPGITVPPPPNVAVPLSLTTYATILTQFTSVTGTVNSDATVSLYTLNKTSFPLQGKSSEISSGMWMAVSALAGSVCGDLYAKELAQPAASRVYYNDLVLGSTNNFNQVIGGATVKSRLYKKFALGFWGRASLADEEAEWDSALSGAGFNLSSLSADETRQAVLILCSGALASLSAISI